MKSREDLIYDLIFSKENEFEIDMADYIKKIYKYEDFIEEIQKILRKSKVMIVSEGVEIGHTEKDLKVIWRLKVKK
jgi:hypothetical protein